MSSYDAKNADFSGFENNSSDFTIVVFNVVDFMLPLIITNVGGFNGAAIFRLLRVFRAVKAIRALRVLRTIRFLANLQVIMATLLQSIRSIGAIVTLITLTMYMFAVIGRGLYADLDDAHFGNLFASILTLFQLLTLDDWFDIYNHISQQGRWHIFLYLVLYIVIEYFIFLNLFVAVLVDNFQLSLEAANEIAKQKKRNQVDSDDEDEYHPTEVASESSASSEMSEDTNKLKRKTLEEHYPNMTDRDRETMKHYFHLLASMEYNHMMLNRQQRVLDMMVDLCANKHEEVV